MRNTIFAVVLIAIAGISCCSRSLQEKVLSIFVGKAAVEGVKATAEALLEADRKAIVAEIQRIPTTIRELAAEAGPIDPNFDWDALIPSEQERQKMVEWYADPYSERFWETVREYHQENRVFPGAVRRTTVLQMLAEFHCVLGNCQNAMRVVDLLVTTGRRLAACAALAEMATRGCCPEEVKAALLIHECEALWDEQERYDDLYREHGEPFQ